MKIRGDLVRFNIFLLAALLAAPSLSAANPSSSTLTTSDLTLQVVDQAGNPLTIEHIHGWPKIQPQEDQSYALRLTNLTNERIGVVTAIDGVDPFTGKKAYRGQSPRVIDPGQTLVIDNIGKRKAAKQPLRLDPQRNVGSIDVISYRENMTYPHRLPWSPQLQKAVGGEVRPGAHRGDLLWLPPHGAPFRKLSIDPHSQLHLDYGVSEMANAR